MVRLAIAVALVLLGGCRKKAPEAGESLVIDRQEEVQQARPEVIGPIRWWDKTGLCLEIPEGWSGAGRGPNGTLLTLERAESGVRFGIYEASFKPERTDLVRVFQDQGTYRDIPALGDTGVETWTSDVPGGPSMQVWLAEVRGVPIRVEARYPFGHGFTGMAETESLLRALCVE